MEGKSAVRKDAAFDVVGNYQQDSINGFGTEVLDSFLDAVNPSEAESILDAMAGDGNLTRYLADYCEKRKIRMPKTSVLEYSRVQSEFARMRLADFGSTVYWADVLSMRTRDTEERLPEQSFDRVMIKSANHEIPWGEQAALAQSLFDVLKPGGTLVNLGFLFDDSEERDEFRKIAKTKDTLAGMDDAAQRRHFLTREEYYTTLYAAGFREIRSQRAVDYQINSHPVALHYFKGDRQIEFDLEHQAAQVRARKMRANGRIQFMGVQSTMFCPGEITVARRPTIAESRADQFGRYPYEFLRRIGAHREMLELVQSCISSRDTVLDLGCGPGLLAERLDGRVSGYHGIDGDEKFIAACSESLSHAKGFSFECGDLNEVDFGSAQRSVVTILNVLYLPGLDVINILRRALASLAKGGQIVLSGPISQRSFEHASPHIRDQLVRDGLLPQYAHTFEEICRVNGELLSERGNYWSAEGMVALLQTLGLSDISVARDDLYYGASYLIVGRK